MTYYGPKRQGGVVWLIVLAACIIGFSPSVTAEGRMFSVHETPEAFEHEDAVSGFTRPQSSLSDVTSIQPSVPGASISENDVAGAGGGHGHQALFIGGDGLGSLNTRNVHRYTGYATVAAALVTGVSNSSHDFHCKAAKSTAALAAITVLTGVMSYGFPVPDTADITSPMTMHPLLGTAGMICCAASVWMAVEDDESSSHAGLGVAGAGLMAASVVVMRW